MERGFPIVSLTKQKLNTQSSTESELVGVDDMMPSILDTILFKGTRVSHQRAVLFHHRSDFERRSLSGMVS